MRSFGRPSVAFASLLALALALRLGFSLGYWVEKPLTHDEHEYWTLSRNLLAGRGLVYDDDGREHFGRAPGYPVFLAAVGLVDESPAGMKIAQSVLGTLGVALVGRLGTAAAGPAAGLAATAIAAIYPPLVCMPAYVLSETLYSLLALWSTLLLWRAFERPSPARFVAIGVLVGVTALVRPIAVPFLAFVTVALLLRRELVAAAAIVIGAAIVIAPWAAWKTHESGRFIVIASEGGITFWTGNHPLAIGEGDMAANPGIQRANRELRAAHPGLSPEALEPVYYREAVAWIRAEPLRFATLVARKLLYLCVPIGPSYLLHSALYRWTAWLSYLVLLPLALAGVPQVLRSRDHGLPLWLLAGSVAATSLVFFPQDRYRPPAIDPVLIVCAACTGAEIIRNRIRA
jgi:hypothetical protein